MVEADWPWIAQRARSVRCEDTKGLVAEEEGKILAAAAMDSWTYTGCTVHIAVDDPRVFAAGFIQEIKHYVFEQAGRKFILGLTPSDNAASLALQKLIGMREICRIVDGYREGVDYIISRIDRDGKERSSST